MHTILVAEDDKSILDLIGLNLEEEGFRIIKAENGLEALNLFKDNQVSLLILDIMMPGLDGFNVLRKIRDISHVPTIFLTSRCNEMDKVLGLSLGADDYIEKPFAMQELKARINAQIRRCYNYKSRKSSACEDTLTNGNISLNISSYTCIVKNEEISLNAKEFQILKLFMMNTDHVFTKQQIYNAIWSEDYLFDINTVQVHISNLRNKVDKDKEMIKTIRSIGYKMVEYK